MSEENNAFELDKIITKISQIEVPDLSNEHLSYKGQRVQKPVNDFVYNILFSIFAEQSRIFGNLQRPSHLFFFI